MTPGTRDDAGGVVVAVSAKAGHGVRKPNREAIRLVEGRGVEGDAHYGEKVKHRSRVRADPDQPNLRQVHLIHAELFDELRERGIDVGPGEMGENVTTRGVDLLGLPRGTRLEIGDDVELELTGLRNPCTQLDAIHPGLMKATLEEVDGTIRRKAGVMAVVISGGPVRAGDLIAAVLPDGPRVPLEPV